MNTCAVNAERIGARHFAFAHSDSKTQFFIIPGRRQ
jgi:hypothetical protein